MAALNMSLLTGSPGLACGGQALETRSSLEPQSFCEKGLLGSPSCSGRIFAHGSCSDSRLRWNQSCISQAATTFESQNTPCKFLRSSLPGFTTDYLSISRRTRFRKYRTCSSLPPGSADNSETEKEKTGEQESQSTTDVTAEKPVRSSTGSLDSYFSKLEQLSNAPVSSPNTNVTMSSTTTSSASSPAVESKQSKDQKALRSLDAYFDMLNPKPAEPIAPEKPAAMEAPAKQEPPPPTAEKRPSIERDLEKLLGDNASSPDVEEVVKEVRGLLIEVSKTIEEEESRRRLFENWRYEYEERRAPFVVNVMVAINIGVYLLELSTLQPAPGELSVSLPSLYFAKVNGLIEAGEWWRLITAMFLHDGFLHLLGSTWVLLSLGPIVETAYGPLGFFLSYFIGGIFGNLISFTETQAITVGGTGPLYGVVAAWVVFLLRNRTAIGEEAADEYIRTAVILGILNIVLPVPLPIDNWTHIGGALGGVLYASLATPEIVRVPIPEGGEEPSQGGGAEDKEGRASQGGSPSTSSGGDSPWFPGDEMDPFRMRRASGGKVREGDEGIKLETRDIGVLKKLVVGALCVGVFASLFQATIGLGNLDFDLVSPSLDDLM